MNKVIENKIKNDSEGPTLDFKQKEYPLGKHPKKHELLKDISAFANHPSDNDKFIIIGVSEKDGLSDEIFDIENKYDDSDYQQYVIANIEPKINFEYKPITYNGKQIAYFRIFGNKSRPYLFKNDVKYKDRMKYEAGDGYIRVGSSSDKLMRDDFESIYETRFTQKDRKSDLEIEGYFGTPDDIEIPKNTLKYVDLKVTNKSNKSIDFDIEIKFQQNKKCPIVLRSEFIYDFNKSQRKDSSHFAYYTPTFPYENFNVDFKEYEDYVIISRNIRPQKKSAITLKQHSIMGDIFFQELLVLNLDVEEINAEVTIRSDDFTEGPLVKELIFSKQKNTD